MGRLWLALALLIALGASAFAYMPHVPDLPRAPSLPAPQVSRVYLEIGEPRASSGMYDVTRLQLDARFDPSATQVRIMLRASNGEAYSIFTTPDRLLLVRPGLRAPVGTSELFVSQIDEHGLESLRAQVPVVAQREHPVREHPIRCGTGFGFLFILVPCALLLLVLGTLLTMRATEVQRTRTRRETEPTELAQPAAEDHIRSVVVRAALATVVVAAILAVSISVALSTSDDALFVPIFIGGPLLLVIGLPAILRIVNAGRAIALLHRPGAVACTRFDQLEVAAGGRHVTLRSTPTLVERARRHALPRATL